MSTQEQSESVLCIGELDVDQLSKFFGDHGLTLKPVADGQDIPGSHWGEREAGLIKHSLYYRMDTPVHSILHEAGHWLMMDDARRKALHSDALGSQAEEDAVCYLQVLMAELVPGMGCERMFTDMDNWGYSFMAGRSRTWFFEDASDAKATLLQRLKSAPLLAQQLSHCAVSDMA
ncbi:MAG: hypothetical protein V3U65_14805 [Granulosicoccaceae bacterium]